MKGISQRESPHPYLSYKVRDISNRSISLTKNTKYMGLFEVVRKYRGLFGLKEKRKKKKRKR